MVLENSASWEPGTEGGDITSMVPELGGGVPLIKVVGIGGGGSNAVSRMFKEKLPTVEYYGINTDAQHLFRCEVSHRLAIGQTLTRGLGSGANPDLGRQRRKRAVPTSKWPWKELTWSSWQSAWAVAQAPEPHPL